MMLLLLLCGILLLVLVLSFLSLVKVDTTDSIDSTGQDNEETIWSTISYDAVDGFSPIQKPITPDNLLPGVIHQTLLHSRDC